MDKLINILNNMVHLPQIRLPRGKNNIMYINYSEWPMIAIVEFVEKGGHIRRVYLGDDRKEKIELSVKD